MPVDLQEGTEAPLPSEILPRALYRYAGVSREEPDRLEGIRRLLVESELYFTSPRTFNDPLDSKGVSLEFIASALKAEQYWRNSYKRIAANRLPLGVPPRERKRWIQRMIANQRTEAGRDRFTNQALHR